MSIILGFCSTCDRDQVEFKPKNRLVCKACIVERERCWRKANPEKVTEYDRRKVQSAAYKARIFTPEYRAKARAKAKRALQDPRLRPAILKSARKQHLKAYGLTEASYQILLDQQNGRCAICLKLPTDNRKLSVDHDHETGKVRGLLCNPCNGSLGLFKEDLGLLMKATLYLEKHQ